MAKRLRHEFYIEVTLVYEYRELSPSKHDLLCKTDRYITIWPSRIIVSLCCYMCQNHASLNLPSCLKSPHSFWKLDYEPMSCCVINKFRVKWNLKPNYTFHKNDIYTENVELLVSPRYGLDNIYCPGNHSQCCTYGAINQNANKCWKQNHTAGNPYFSERVINLIRVWQILQFNLNVGTEKNTWFFYISLCPMCRVS